MSGQFDIVVIGAGPGGYVAAIRAAQLGLKTAIVESRGTGGGTCLNVGCIPSKALLESSEIYEHTKDHASNYGVDVSGVQFNLPKMLERKDKIVGELTGGVDGLLKKNKVEYLLGYASFVDSKTVAVKLNDGGQTELKAKNIIIATGSSPIELPFAKFDGNVIGSSTDALSYSSVPKHLILIGGGVIGLELGSVWARLGARVTVIEAQPRILPTNDGEVSKFMLRTLKKQGLEFAVDTMVKSIETKGDHATVTCEHKGETKTYEGDKVLVAVGRRANTDGLNVESISLQMDRGKVVTDAHYRTNVSGVYAIGDVTDGPMLAHKAEDEGLACAEIIAGKPGHVNYEAIPGVVYTNPEVASIGKSEEELKEAGIAYNTGKFQFRANGRAKCMGQIDGFIKLLADKKTDRLIGAHMVGPKASELIAELVMAFEFGASAEDVARSVHAHPTLSEVIKEAAMGVDKRTIHS